MSSPDAPAGPSLAQLYQGIILEHHGSPRNAGPLPDADREARADNPLCGDRVTLRLRLDGERIAAARFEADGCSISIASASLLTLAVTGASLEEARATARELRRLLSRDDAEHAGADRARLGDLVALEGTRRYPPRIKCALLPWEALAAALGGER